MHVAGLQFVEERVERPTNPEVFFDILFVCSEAGGSANKEIAALIVVGGQYGLKTLGHLLLEPLAFLMIGAGARLEGFALSVGSGTTALTCRSRSRTITRIHSGIADRPLRKSF